MQATTSPTMASNDKTKRTSLSIKQKLEILQQLANKIPVTAIARDYHVHETTVRRVRKNTTRINRAANRGFGILKQKKLRKAPYRDLEDQLYAWFEERRKLGDPLSDLILRQKALELIKEFGGESTFKASVGWTMKFKNRYGIRLTDVYGEKGRANVEAAERFALDFARRIEEEGIEHDNIYNMDDSGLIWKALPLRTLVHDKDKDVSGTNGKQDRVTVGFCANMTGTHKLKPLLIHTLHNPRAIMKIMDSLPVVYKGQRSGLMNDTVFVDWFQNYFKPAVRGFQQQGGTPGKVILLVDNCIARKLKSTEFQEDSQFEILFLPPNTTSTIQPMNQGVILKAKRIYHCRMLRRVVSYFGSIQEFSQKYNLKDCIDLLDEAWGEISASDIRNSWNNIMKTAHEGTPAGEEPTDPLEPQLVEVIAAITGEEPCQERVKEFLTNCHCAETNFSEAEAQNGGAEEEEEEEEATEVAKQEGEEETREEIEAHEEKIRVDEDKSNKEDTEMQEIRRALEFFTKRTERAPGYVKRSVENLKDYFLGEET